MTLCTPKHILFTKTLTEITRTSGRTWAFSKTSERISTSFSSVIVLARDALRVLFTSYGQYLKCLINASAYFGVIKKFVRSTMQYTL